MNKKLLTTLSMTGIMFFNSPLQADIFETKKPTLIQLNHEALSSQAKALLYLNCGYSNLISKDYQAAFDDYQKALDTLGCSENNGIEFLASFGMTVACDNLHLMNDAKQQILRIKNLMYTSGQRENNMAESNSQDDREVTNHLNQLASMSASDEVRRVLSSVISEIFSSSLTSHSGFPLYKRAPNIVSYPTSLKATPCRSIWKTLKKIRDEIIETWNSFFKIYKDCKEIREDLSKQQINELSV